MGLSKEFAGQKVELKSKDGTFLFALGTQNSTTVLEFIAQDFYDNHRIQWVEPEADNYLPLVDKNPQIGSLPHFKHFSWQDIANFAMVDRLPISYASGWNGDWKAVSDGADGFLLVTVDKTPYWADGVGQIPFAVGTFKHYLKKGYNEADSIKYTLLEAQKHATGNIIPTAPVIVNEYDDYFVLRGAIWASRKYDSKTETDSYWEPELHRNITNTLTTVFPGKINPPASELGKPLTPDIPRKYGLIN
jgi:hypothetical protein